MLQVLAWDVAELESAEIVADLVQPAFRQQRGGLRKWMKCRLLGLTPAG